MLLSCWSRRMLSNVPHRPPLMFWQLAQRAWHPLGIKDRAAPKPKLANLTWHKSRHTNFGSCLKSERCIFKERCCRCTIIHKLTARGFQILDAVNVITFYSNIKRKLGWCWLAFKLVMAKTVSTLSREPLRLTCVETYFWRQKENLLCASFCLWALPQVIWVLFCHIIQTSRNVFSWEQCLKCKLKNRKQMSWFWRLQCHNSVNSWHIHACLNCHWL